VRFPHWCKIQFWIWALTGVPVYVLTAMYAGRMWPIPDLPHEYLPVWQWLLGCIFLYHGLLTLPIALWLGSKAKNTRAQD